MGHFLFFKTLIGLITLCCLSVVLVACGGAAPAPSSPAATQVAGMETSSGGGAAPPALAQDMLSPPQQQRIQATLARQEALLAQQGIFRTIPSDLPVKFSWPLRMAKGSEDYGYYRLVALVDHNEQFPDQLLDYDGGKRTYDLFNGYNHTGTDISLWPFAWQKMRAGQVEVIAAADGIIIDKSDGNADESCSLDMNKEWNAIYVRHSDGSIAWYGHLKKGSLTQKDRGSKVMAGEYLGLVGSSGNSKGPHLHFELHSASGSILDPFAGPDNRAIGSSLWQQQRPYYESGINHLATATAPPEFPACPVNETSNEQTRFERGALIYFVSYYRDQRPDQLSEYRIYRPDGSVYKQWKKSNTNTFYDASYWWWSFRMPSTEATGAWLFEVFYEGQTYRHTFTLQ